MSCREENVCVYANGEIYETEEGDAFKCRRVKVIRVKSDITLDALKKIVGRKLRLNENQVVTELVYRHPLSLNPTRYKACELEDDDDIQRMWEANARFPSQLSCPEVYAHISAVELDLNMPSQLNDASHPHMVPPMNILPEYNAGPSYYNPAHDGTEPMNRENEYGHPFQASLAGYASDTHGSEPYYSGLQSPLSPGETEDIMDEFEDEDAYDDLPEGFDGRNDNNDDDGDDYGEDDDSPP